MISLCFLTLDTCNQSPPTLATLPVIFARTILDLQNLSPNKPSPLYSVFVLFLNKYNKIKGNNFLFNNKVSNDYIPELPLSFIK